MIGSQQAIVLEKPGDRGHTPGFAELRLAGPRDDIGQILTTRVTGATDDHLIGTPI